MRKGKYRKSHCYHWNWNHAVSSMNKECGVYKNHSREKNIQHSLKKLDV